MQQPLRDLLEPAQQDALDRVRTALIPAGLSIPTPVPGSLVLPPQEEFERE